MNLMVRRVIAISVAIAFAVVLYWITANYLDQELRKAIVYSGFGMC